MRKKQTKQKLFVTETIVQKPLVYINGQAAIELFIF